MIKHHRTLARATACGLMIAAVMPAAAQTAATSAPATVAPTDGTVVQSHQPEDTAVPKAAGVAKPLAPSPARDTLTGDWGGVRTDLAEAGISLRADYVSESFAAVSGGLRRGTAYTQQIRAGVDLDLGALAGWSGALVHVTLNDRRGDGISSDFVGNRLPIQEAYGGQYTRLSEVSVEQNLAGGKLNLRLGYFAMGNDLGGMPLGCNFVNAAFCAHPLSMSGNSGWYNYPNARWGLALRYRPRADLAVRTGVYQVNTRLGLEDNAFDPFAGGTTGILLPIEIEYDPGARPGSRVMPGHYKLGFYYDTSRAARQGEAGTLTGRHGVYLLADQMIVRGSGSRGLSVFAQFTANPQASAQITRWYAGGLVKTGTFAGRDADTLALGLISATVDPRLRRFHADTVALSGGYASLPMGETALELSYGVQLRRWLNIRPDVQYIIDPGAFSFRSTPNALAIGSQIKAQF
ncbi:MULTISPECIES: carbohydrate porin [unclassified Sphingomonas]|uniref:carbohydrate porin n=1 Tax=unclassified Sphingomonas TaxID=196159 RepID=UPI00226AA993|nr:MULTISPECIES: carbohydrate porin [unclassified Sphingomonas]